MNEDIKNILSKNSCVRDVIVSNVVRVHTQIECTSENLDSVRKEIYELELEVMKKYPDALLDFTVSRKKDANV